MSIIELLTRLFGWIARFLESFSSGTASEEKENSDQQVSDGDQSDSSSTPETPPTPYWEEIIHAHKEHRRWLRNNPLVIGVLLVLLIVIIITQQWLIQVWLWMTSIARLVWDFLIDHRLALIVAGIFLFYLIFGLQWIRPLGRWFTDTLSKKKGLAIALGGIGLLIALWLFSNSGTWVVLPLRHGELEADPQIGEKASIQLIAELDSVRLGGVGGVYSQWELQEPRTSSGSITMLSELPLEECDEILKGPGGFLRSSTISFSSSTPGSTNVGNTEGERLDLGNFSLGAVSIPSQLFIQPILMVAPIDYREFQGQIFESSDELEISISTRNPSKAWQVSGPSNDFSEMLEYLARRITIDMNAQLIPPSETGGAKTSLPSNWELAFSLGNSAFSTQNYRRAKSFYELATRFEPTIGDAHAMLSLTYYHLFGQPNFESIRFEQALQEMETAILRGREDERGLLRPYLACLYHKVGQSDLAEEQIALYGEYLDELADVRRTSLKKLHVRGPGKNLVGDGNFVLFVNEAGNLAGIRPDQSVGPLLDLWETNKFPRQVEIGGKTSPLIVTQDGRVLSYSYPEMIGSTIIWSNQLDGVQQAALSTTVDGAQILFLLNRQGQVYWCQPEENAGSLSVCSPGDPIFPEVQPDALESPSDNSEFPFALQIFPVEEELYILANNGSIWMLQIEDGGVSAPQVITVGSRVQEIFVSNDGTLYILNDDGQILRYDASQPGIDEPQLIDQGTSTTQIFIAGEDLYVLKNNGALWRISNSRDPDPDNDFTKLELLLSEESTPGAFIEMYITEMETQEAGASTTRIIYLLTDKRELLRGIDTGGESITLSQLYPELLEAAKPQ